MPDFKQLSFGDFELSLSRKKTLTEIRLDAINDMVDWQPLLDRFAVIDKTQTGKGGRPRKPLIWMIKALFLQGMYNLSDPQLEEQLADRLSFQRFVGIGSSHKIPDFTTVWRFKEALIAAGLKDAIFEEVLLQLEKKNLIVKRGTIVDATILESANKPLSDAKREQLKGQPNPQIDIDANATKKNGRFYFGYKGHIGVDVGSKIIRKQVFTKASVHDSQLTEKLISYDEAALFGDKAYADTAYKVMARMFDWCYCILDKATKWEKLSPKQIRRNERFSKIRAQVEHAFGWMKTKGGLTALRAKSQDRNAFTFAMSCTMWNLNRAVFLTKPVTLMGAVCQ
jgi:IS5 family transposase